MNQTEREEFGAYLRSLREAEGLTQRDAASRAGISAPYLAQVERGQRNPPSREMLERIAQVYSADEQRVMHSAGYASEGETRKALGDIDMSRLDWAFKAVISDPNFALGTRMNKTKITPEVKAWVVQIYQKTQGNQLLSDKERAALPEIINNAEDIPASFDPNN